jgi:hypothetical protein
MHLKQRSIVRKTMMLVTAIAIVTAVATDVLAAGRGGEGGGVGAGESRGTISEGGFGGPLPDSAPEMPPPIFNPSTPYTVPPPGETPVSPASPGSVFGNE